MGSFITWNAVTSDLSASSGPMAGTTLTSTAKTILQLAPASTTKIIINEWGFNFLGTTLPNAPVQLELVDTGTVFATVTAGSIASYSAADSSLGPLAQTGTALTGFNSSNEGTITSTRLLAQKSYPADWSQQYPLGREPQVLGGHSLRIRGTAASGSPVVACYIVFEEVT